MTSFFIGIAGLMLIVVIFVVGVLTVTSDTTKTEFLLVPAYEEGSVYLNLASTQRL